MNKNSDLSHLNNADSFADWLLSLPADVHVRLLAKICDVCDPPLVVFKSLVDDEEAPLTVKLLIELTSRNEGFPFSFNDRRVSMLGKYLQLFGILLISDNPEISREDMAKVIEPFYDETCAAYSDMSPEEMDRMEAKLDSYLQKLNVKYP